MRNDTLQEVTLDICGFTKTITVNVQTQALRIEMYNSLHLPYRLPVYWVFVRVGKGKYEFDHIAQR